MGLPYQPYLPRYALQAAWHKLGGIIDSIRQFSMQVGSRVLAIDDILSI